MRQYGVVDPAAYDAQGSRGFERFGIFVAV
jgi:hypothetical protein